MLSVVNALVNIYIILYIVYIYTVYYTLVVPSGTENCMCQNVYAVCILQNSGE